MFIWPKANRKDFTAQDVTSLEYKLVKRNLLKKWLEQKGLSVARLRTIARSLRTHGFNEKVTEWNSRLYDNTGVRFYKTQKIKKIEEPINLLVNKDIYETLKVAIDEPISLKGGRVNLPPH